MAPGLIAYFLTTSLQIESETSNSERNLDDAMGRLGTLEQEINAQKTKRAENTMAAARAEETATMARDKANEAKQVGVALNASLNTARGGESNLSAFCSDSRGPADRQLQ